MLETGELIPKLKHWGSELAIGREKLSKANLQLTQTQAQKDRAANLLLASQSPAAFVQSCLQRGDGEITAVDLYAHYQEWCSENGVRPVASQAFTQLAKQGIELKLGLRYRHDVGPENTNRGWKGVGLIEQGEIEML